MQFTNFSTDGEHFDAPASQDGRSASRSPYTSLSATARTATTLALSMLAFNITAFIPAGAAPTAKPAAKTASAKPAVVKKAPVKVAAAHPAATPAASPYLPKHRSIWAIRWAAAHPAQEAVFQAQLQRRWRARHHLPMVGVAKALPASHALAKTAAKPVAAKAVAHAPLKVAAKPIAHKAAPAVKHAAAAAVPVKHAAPKVATVKHAPAKIAVKPTAKPAAKKPAAKIAEAVPAAHKPAVHIAQAVVKPAVHVAKTAPAHARIVPAPKHLVVATARPASKASAGKIRLAKTHITHLAAAPAPVHIRAAAIKQAVASSRPAVTQLASTATITSVSTSVARQSQAAATSLQGSDTVTLDFVAADINDVLKALAVQTGANIVSSADVKGTVTVSLADVTLEQALDMVARLSGYEYAKVGNTYVVGTSTGIQALTGAAGGSQQQATEVVTFNYADPDDVIATLKQRFPEMDVSKGTSISGVKAGAGTKALILTGDPSLIDQAKTLIGQIDQSMGANVQNESTVAYRVKYASLSDLISILGNLVPQLVVTPGPAQGFTAKAPSAAATASSSSGSVSSSSSSSGSSGSSGSSQASATGPTILLLTGTETDIARAQQILGQVDVQPKQILFETKVVEMSNDAERQLGLQYDFSGAHTSIGEDLPAGTQSIPTVEPDPYPGNVLKGRTFGRTYITDLVTVQLAALQTQGKAHLLADPNISAIDGQAAQVFIGDEVNYVSSITTSTTGENVTTATVQAGVIFRVTGKVDGDGYITLNIHPEVSSITGWTTVPGGGQLPEVSTRYADTTVRVKDGDTIAIGGLIQENDIENIQKVPILGDLPFFGQLFRYNDHNKQSDQVVFFLKTSIMDQQ